MAVTFVIGNAYRISAIAVRPGNSIASALANEFNEAADPVHSAALIMLGLVLFLLTFHRSRLLALLLIAARARAKGGRRDADGNAPALSQAACRQPLQPRDVAWRTMAFGMVFLLWILSILFYRGIRARCRRRCSRRRRRRPALPGARQRHLRQRRHRAVSLRSSARRSAFLPASTSPSTARTAGSRALTRFINDILLSAPSIVIGLFIYTVYVAKVEHFSGWAGLVARSP